MLALTLAASAFAPPTLAPRPASAVRAAEPLMVAKQNFGPIKNPGSGVSVAATEYFSFKSPLSLMQPLPLFFSLSSQVVRLDQYGDFTPRGGNTKGPIKILSRVEELKVLSSLADAGVLSSLEASGTFTKLESAGAFSTIEKVLPLADDLKLLSTAEALLQVPSGFLLLGAVALIGGEAALLQVLPSDGVFGTVGLVSGVAVGLGSVVLVAISFLFGLLQGKD